MAKLNYDPTQRFRNWFIEINQGAECFEHLLEIVESWHGVTLYALIFHDKDKHLKTSVDTQTGETTQAWEIQPKHAHLCLELKNACTFSAIQKKLPGAHIDVMEARKSAYLYLTHESPNSKGIKYQYAFEEIISNNIEEVKRLVTQCDQFEPFHEEDAMLYIAQGTTNYYYFVKRFGLSQAGKWWRSYMLLIEASHQVAEAQQEIEALQMDMKAEDEW